MQINWFVLTTAALMLGGSIQQYFWKGDWRLGVLYFTWAIGNSVLAFSTAK
jgi:hypothetical protein